MKNNDLISVIIPVYNVEKYLDRCLTSVINQTYTKLEIILIDDGSTDNCPQICDEWAKNEQRIKVIHKKNEGVSSARNLGINMSSGEYISFIDSDDILHPKYFEIMHKSIDNADLSYCEYMRFNDECSFEEMNDYDKETYTGNHVFDNSMLSIDIVWNKLIRKKSLNGLKFDTELKNGEDTLFSYNLLCKCNSVVYVKNEMYGYFIRKSGASISADLKGKKDLAKVLTYIYNSIDIYKNKKLKENMEINLYNAYLILYKECKNQKLKERFIYKRTVRHMLHSILLFNPTLNYKGKMILVIRTLFLQ